MSDTLKQRIKALIIETLQLEETDPDRIDDSEPLMESGLDLDSIDTLELVVAMEKEFGIKIKSSEEAREALRNVDSLALFIEHKQKTAEPT